MAIVDQLTIRPFRAADQAAAKELILAGLGERWGWIDPTLNPDLNDIATTYADGIFLVGYLTGHLADTLVVTGALTPETTPEGTPVLRVERMSVRADLRGQGLGRRMLDALLDEARARGCTRIVLETTSSWIDAVRFYQRYGFTFVAEHDDETHMQLYLDR